MKYSQGRIGRVFVIKFEDGDILAEELIDLAREQKIRSASFVFLGALKKGDLVTGPKKPVVPPEPNWVSFRDGWEVLGMGSLFTGKLGPQIHVHSSMGKKNKVLTGCVRKKSSVFLVIEAFLFEIKGIRASKDIDPATGLNLLRIG